MQRIFLLLFAMIISVALVACGDSDISDANNDTDKNNTEQSDDHNDDSEAESNEHYGEGDTVEVADIKFTFTNVSTTDERNEFADTEPTHVVKIEYEIENNSDEEIPIGMDLELYDGTGSKMDTYPLDSTMGSLQPGKKIQGQEFFGFEEGPLELYFQPMISFEDPAVFELDVE